tara:strand:- start:3338 stop:4225 length:888 start_codon:yes stop_codon:yes gene_type:complete
MELIEILKSNRIDYEQLKNESVVNLITDDSNYYINIIIGFRGRTEFIQPMVDSFNESIKYYNNISDKKVCLTFVEHDDEPKHLELLDKVNYIWSKGNVSEFYNRSFAYNFGVRYSNKSKYYILHDLDILVKPNYIEELVTNLNNDTVQCMQSYGNRHVWYMSEQLTSKFLNKEITIDDINRDNTEIIPPQQKGSKGGSVIITKKLFDDVGGFDPELFWGYAAEDQMFWAKVDSIVPISYADNPPIDIFHMWHPPTDSTNPNTPRMDSYFLHYQSMNSEYKLNFLNEKLKLYETNS